MMRGEASQSLWQLAGCLPAEFSDGFWRIGGAVGAAFTDLRPLALDPRLLLFGEQLGIPAGSPTRNGNTHTSVGPYPYDIASSRRMANEIHERITIVLRHGYCIGRVQNNAGYRPPPHRRFGDDRRSGPVRNAASNLKTGAARVGSSRQSSRLRRRLPILPCLVPQRIRRRRRWLVRGLSARR